MLTVAFGKFQIQISKSEEEEGNPKFEMLNSDKAERQGDGSGNGN